jgi:CheY-like chemotaxis protein
MKRVLVVDDDPDILLGVEAFLGDRYEVVVASNGALALGKLESQRFDAVVLDLMMPVMDGASFLSAMEGRGLHRNLLQASMLLPLARAARSTA